MRILINIADRSHSILQSRIKTSSNRVSLCDTTIHEPGSLCGLRPHPQPTQPTHIKVGVLQSSVRARRVAAFSTRLSEQTARAPSRLPWCRARSTYSAWYARRPTTTSSRSRPGACYGVEVRGHPHPGTEALSSVSVTRCLKRSRVTTFFVRCF